MQISAHLFLTDILPEKRRLYDKFVKNKIFEKSTAKNVFAELKRVGINGIEVLIPSSLKKSDILDLKKTADENGIKIFSIHQPLRFLTKTRPGEITKLFEIADILSAKVLVLHMSSVGKQLFDQEYVSILHDLEKKYKIKIGFENQERHLGSMLNTYSWDEKKFPALMKKSEFYITLDTCHLGQAGGDIIKFYKNNKDRIVNIHISDYKSHYLNSSLRPIRYKHLPIGKGDLPLYDFIELLKKENYKGLLTFEIKTDLKGLVQSAESVVKTI